MTENNQNQPRLIPKSGEENFADLRRKGIYYVDKTQYLKPLFIGTNDRLLLLRDELPASRRHLFAAGALPGT